ncbi:MAG: ATP-binding protein [Oscillospiraceae bacterium]|nr:ATP-binding protein [Oscillospiraceae bacterium]
MNHITNTNISKDSVEEITRICSYLYSDGIDTDAFVQAGNNARITIISSDGEVLSDNRPLDTDIVENHLKRPEIQAALNNSPQAYIRVSKTLEKALIYYALKVDTDDGYVFVRAAIPVEQINARLFQTFPILLLILFVLAVVYIAFIRNMVNRITKPFNSIEKKLRSLSKGEYRQTPVEGSYEEIERFTQVIDEIAVVLQNGFDSLSDEKSKLAYIMDNISDGIFTVDKNGNITLINKSALNIFDADNDVIGRDMLYLSSYKALMETVRDCIKSKNNALFEISLNGIIFLVTVKPLPATDLTMTIMSDVTENRENAKRREEFFANASHELKTPLTAIKGFTELTSINNKDDNISKYINSITRETERMLLLIGDMLKISEIENSQKAKPDLAALKPVPIFDIINDVRDTMSTIINEKEIYFKVVGSVYESTITAEPGHIYDIVKNLVENAVRYNKQGGEVRVAVKNKKNIVRLIVSDNGIGIPVDEQARIFERFYRVEKSRSEIGGGTGLGLAIAKHICSLYGWKLSLKSRVDVGTEVTVEF